jgi:acyl-CoA synthetase (AMP-forming)/AMP-acid ligase II
MTFVEAFLQHSGDKPALHFPDSNEPAVSYADLERMTNSLIARMLDNGVASGSIVAVDVANDLLHAVLLLGCARAGIATIAGLPGHLGDVLRVTALVTDRPSAAANPIATTDVRLIVLDAGWLDGAGTGLERLNLIQPRPDDLCRIMLTSGSTGKPKGVALTYQMVEERLLSYSHAFGPQFARFGKIMCGMKLSSSLGFGFLFYSVMRGGLFCSDSADFDRITAAIKQHRIEVLMAAPFMLAELLAFCDAQAKPFAPVALAMTAGSLVSPSLGRKIKGRLCDELVIFYGTTETGVVASTSEFGEPGDVGSVVEGRQVDIVGFNGEILASGERGTIRITARAAPLPYFDMPDLAEKSLRHSFSPGDIGFIDSRGHLIIQGRSDDLINAGGTKVTPELLEQALSAAPGVRDCGVLRERDNLGIDRIVAFLVLLPQWNQAAFLAYCETAIVRELLPSKFVLVQQIPRNQNGKIDRAALAKLSG